MNSKQFSIFVLCIFVLFISPNSASVLADHGSGGGGGGCSGDCAPPTLGLDNAGREHIKGGFSVNGESYDVVHTRQDIPTQIIKSNEPVVITFKIYENTGYRNLSHVALFLGLEDKYVDGMLTHFHPVKIVWEQSFNGNISVNEDDPNDLVSNVDVTHNLIEDVYGNKNRATEINFKFTPTKTFDATPVLVEMWDYEKNSWRNYFDNPIQIKQVSFSETIESNAQVPNWFKTNAGYWAKNQIPDEAFANGIIFLIENQIMHIPNLQKFEPEPLLHFIDTNKGAQHYIDRYYNDEVYKEWFDSNFPEYTIEEAVGMPSELSIPEWVKINAERWSNGSISDIEFVNGIKFLIEKGIITV